MESNIRERHDRPIKHHGGRTEATVHDQQSHNSNGLVVTYLRIQLRTLAVVELSAR